MSLLAWQTDIEHLHWLLSWQAQSVSSRQRLNLNQERVQVLNLFLMWGNQLLGQFRLKIYWHISQMEYGTFKLCPTDFSLSTCHQWKYCINRRNSMNSWLWPEMNFCPHYHLWLPKTMKTKTLGCSSEEYYLLSLCLLFCHCIFQKPRWFSGQSYVEPVPLYREFWVHVWLEIYEISKI